jgi:MFS family permease
VNEQSAPLASCPIDEAAAAAPPARIGKWGISTPVWAILLMLAYQNFTVTIIGVAAPWISKSFQLDDSGVARMFAWVSLSALGALVLARMVDRLGRRRMVLWCLAAIPIFSLAAALATNYVAFIIFQIGLNAANGAGISACIVMLAEELPIDQRANGQSLGGLAGAVGGGWCIMIIPLLVAYGISWRWLLVLAAAGIALLPALARMLPESERWQHNEAIGITEKSRFYDVLHPLYRKRSITLIVATLLVATSQAAPQAFAYYHAVSDAKLTAGGASLMTVIGGGIGMVGFPLGAWVCERWGRVPTVVVFGFLMIAGQLWYYWTHAPVFIMPMMWLAASFCLVTTSDSAATVGSNAAVTELFPTALRGTIMGWFAVTAAIGGVASNAIAASLAHVAGGLSSAIGYLALAGIPAAILFALMIDETRGMSLEAAALEDDFRSARE